jgi:hypothetical protein
MAAKRAQAKWPYKTIIVCSSLLLITVLALFSGSQVKEVALYGARLVFGTAQAESAGGSVTGLVIPSGGANISVMAAGTGQRTGLDVAATGCAGQNVTGIVAGTGGGAGPLNVTVGGDGPGTGVRVAAGAVPCK